MNQQSERQAIVAAPAGDEPRAVGKNAPASHTSPTQTFADAQLKPSRLSAIAGSLDSVFYLICGLAVLGLVVSLYALITQNNAFVEREFEQLQRETAALNERLAQLNDTRLSQLRKSEPTDAEPVAPIPDDAVADAAPEHTSNALTDSMNGVAKQPGAIDSGVDTQSVADNVGSAQSVDPNISAAPQSSTLVTEVDTQPVADNGGSIQSTDTKTGADEPVEIAGTTAPDIDALRAELQALRNTVVTQGNQLTQLVEENLRLQRDEVISAVEESVAQPKDPELTVAPPSIDEQTEHSTELHTALPQVTIAEHSRESLSEPPEFASSNANAAQSHLSDAYAAYQQQDYELALQLYQRVIRFDPYHRDASLGAAASATLSGEPGTAEQLYRHLLSLDALDTEAFAGLLRLVAQHPQRAIIELELLQHTEHHNHPVLLTTALGNHFARQQRWRDAELAYAKAVAKPPVTADLTFNYAVVLDRLGQSQRAATRYQQALDLSAEQEVLFDRQAATRRLQSISGGELSSR